MTTKNRKPLNEIVLKENDQFVAWLDKLSAELGESRTNVIHIAMHVLDLMLHPSKKLKKNLHKVIEGLVEEPMRQLNDENDELKKQIKLLKSKDKKRSI